MSIAKTAMHTALPFSQIVGQWLAGMRLPRMMPLMSPTPSATVWVPSGKGNFFLLILTPSWRVNRAFFRVYISARRRCHACPGSGSAPTSAGACPPHEVSQLSRKRSNAQPHPLDVLYGRGRIRVGCTPRIGPGSLDSPCWRSRPGTVTGASATRWRPGATKDSSSRRRPSGARWPASRKSD